MEIKIYEGTRNLIILRFTTLRRPGDGEIRGWRWRILHYPNKGTHSMCAKLMEGETDGETDGEFSLSPMAMDWVNCYIETVELVESAKENLVAMEQQEEDIRRKLKWKFS